MSFTSGTKVLLASGIAVPIASLKAGEKVLATNVRTGKTQAEPVTAVLVHHDTDRYDLKIKADGKTAVIDTTSSHPFWVPGTGRHGGRWVKAGALRYGTHLRAPSGADNATVVGGWVVRQHDGWMWDLTVPGGNDHDFYIDTVAAPVLVHNCNGGVYTLRDEAANVVRSGRTSNLATREYQLSRDPVLGPYRFQVEYRTDVYAEQRGLEQVLYNQYPEARAGVKVEDDALRATCSPQKMMTNYDI